MNCRRQIRHLVALLALLCGAAAHGDDSPAVLIVDLYVNHQRMGEVFALQDAQGDFYIDETALHYWEIRQPWPAPLKFRGDNYYAVEQFAGAAAELDIRSMELRVSMPADLMPSRSVDMRDNGIEAQVDGYGAFMDYELSLLDSGSGYGQSTSGLFHPVLFGPFGNLGSSLVYSRRSSQDTGVDLNVLDLTYTRDDPQRLRSLRIGDVYSNSGSQGRALRIGGIQLATNFSTQPTLITYPLPDFYGQTAVPSALDIYINGRLSQREQVQPGSYVLEDIPVVNGLGQMQVVATDALGRQQIFTQDFYLSTDLLMQGLSDYSFTLGALREDYGLESFRYGDVAGSATWRYGLRNNVTVEGHGEFTRGLAMIGGAMQYGVDAGGTVSAGLGLSNDGAGTGVRWQLGFQRLTSVFNVNLDFSGATRAFQLVGGLGSIPKLQLVAGIGKGFYEYGSARLSVVHQDFHDKAQRTIWSIDYSKRLFGRLSMASFISWLDAEERDLAAGLRFNLAFGDKHSARGGMLTNRSGTSIDAAIQRNLPMNAGYGYHLGVGSSDNRFVDAGVIAQSEYGTYSFDMRTSELNGTAWQAGTRGSLAYMAGMTRFSRQINEAFAVVNVGNLEGVRVYSENLEIGRTDKKGQVFVPGLRPYLKNQLRIELDDLPMNAYIGETRIDTAPYYRSGVVVNFDVHVTTNVLLRAVWPDGSPVPEGAIARVFHTGDIFPVGFDGKLYLQGIDRSSEIEIRWNGTTCNLDVPYPSGSAVIAKMGDIVCVPGKDL